MSPDAVVTMWEAVATAILTDAQVRADDATTATAVAFRAVVPDLPGLTHAERVLLTEWLDRAVST